jgi:hypothetical protein
MKHCPKCGETKPLAEFYGRKKLSGYCKPCDRARTKAGYHADPAAAKARHREWVEKNRDRVRLHKIKSAYGLTADEYAELPQVCVICGCRETLRIDHSHQVGRVRGLLCDPCNKGLGFFRDDPTLLLRAADYVLGVAKPDIFNATYEPVS